MQNDFIEIWITSIIENELFANSPWWRDDTGFSMRNVSLYQEVMTPRNIKLFKEKHTGETQTVTLPALPPGGPASHQKTPVPVVETLQVEALSYPNHRAKR